MARGSKKKEWGVQRIPMLMLLRVTPAGVEPTAKLPVKGRGEEGGGAGEGGSYIPEKFLAIGDSSLLKQEGLQLAEASFREKSLPSCHESAN